ncbi:MAG: hypothetical protein F6J87_09095 [Spirulina sp. SIO3F2]|nr:hypothetical protein [Spirulina sp. SIO3F2]
MSRFRRRAHKDNPVQRHDFLIKEQDLAIALELEWRTFDQMIEPLFQASGAVIVLVEEQHFIYHDRRKQIRLFSQAGVLAIASYLDTLATFSLPETAVRTVLALLEQQEIRKIDASIRRTILQNSSSLRHHNDLHWLSTTDTTKILKTTSSRLAEAQGAIEFSGEAMLVGRHMAEFEGIQYFSLAGLVMLSLELKRSLKSPDRQRYCGRIPKVAPPVVEYLALAPAPSRQAIESAKRFAKKRDKQTCQITGEEPNKFNRLKLAAHHLFDQNTYPVLADEPMNLITISDELHEEFHQWLGGKGKSCTVDDFIQFVEAFYADEKSVIVVELLQRREVLLEKLSRYLPGVSGGDGL